MNCCIKTDPARGRFVCMEDGKIELAAALDFGIRISSLHVIGMENLFYEQPEDCSDGLATKEGWKIRGGHRLWLTPETDRIYWPDNDPVEWEQTEDGILLTQKPEAWMQIQKQLLIRLPGNGEVELSYLLTNLASSPLTTALWQVNTVAGGGTAQIPFGGYTVGAAYPQRHICLWGATDPWDARIHAQEDTIFARHDRNRTEYFKMGIFSSSGQAALVSRGQRLELSFGAENGQEYPDGGCNFELYMNPFIMELETLGTVQTILPGQTARHEERWKLSRL